MCNNRVSMRSGETEREMEEQAANPMIDVLKNRFGLETFRPGQEQLIGAIQAGRDCLGVMPTGAGKSLCYQVPAVALPGMAIVISPLVSLMADQVSALVENGIAAAFLNSQLTAAQQAEVLRRARAGAYKLMYVAPERLDDERFAAFACEAVLSLIAVDEAHCVSQWGQDFRPSYLRIAQFIGTLPIRPPIAAFTATATPKVADDIVRLLALRGPVRVVTGFDRPNLHFAVEQLSGARKLARVAAYASGHPGESGIVYCSTRKDVESVCAALVKTGIAATRYHAGLSAAERTANQRAFVNDDALVMVATNAFGMGIDKSNVRFVIHYNMPGSLEAYYQEAGRAGRDGLPAECLLLWADGDIATCRFFIESDSENEALTAEEKELVRAAQRRRLAAMTEYCLTCACLRKTILAYFGEGEGESESESESGVSAAAVESRNAPANCGNCSNCEGGVDAEDVTLDARAVMRCVHELRGRYGKGIVADVLTGSHSEKVRSFGLTGARTFGILDIPAAKVKEIIELLTAGGYLEISEGRYPLVGLGPRAREAATDGFRLYMKRTVRKQGSGRASAKPAARTTAQLETGAQRELFDRLRALRKRLADEAGVPPYVVFSDAHLRDMCVRMPRTEAEFLQVNGVGQAKLERYGEAFLAEINANESKGHSF